MDMSIFLATCWGNISVIWYIWVLIYLKNEIKCCFFLLLTLEMDLDDMLHVDLIPDNVCVCWFKHKMYLTILNYKLPGPEWNKCRLIFCKQWLKISNIFSACILWTSFSSRGSTFREWVILMFWRVTSCYFVFCDLYGGLYTLLNIINTK